MFLHLLTFIVVIGSLTGKPIVVRNVSDCSITDDNILHYHGKHSFTKFDHECLSWNDLQTVYSDVINEPNFFNDASIKEAKNYCRNPNMNVDGPWCFIQEEDVITMEQCDVCQSLVPKSTPPTDFESIEEVTVTNVNNTYWQRLQDELKRYGAYIREKFHEIVERMRQSFRQIRSRISNHFNF